LNEEKNKTIIENLLNSISSFDKPKETDLKNIFTFIDNKSRILRHSAIRALKHCNSNECEIKLMMILENSTNHYDLYYSIQTLSSSGSLKCISKLKELVKHSNQEVSGSALSTIIKLAKNKEVNLYREQLASGKNKFTALEGVIKFGNEEDIPNVIKRIKDLVSKKRVIEIVGEYGYSEIIIAMFFLLKYPDNKSVSEIYTVLKTKKNEFLWNNEKEWLKNNSIKKGYL
jgi:HEAT repeat protein